MRPYPNPRPLIAPAAQPHQPAQWVPQTAAQQALFSAVTFAPQGDLLTLAKDALAAGASLQATDAHGNDVMMLAVINDRPHAIGTLLALGTRLPDVPADGIDLLMRAAMLDHSECCHELIQIADLDVDSTDAEGRSALFFAVQAGSAASARILVAAGAKVNLVTDRLSDGALRILFGLNHQLEGRKVTLAMVAAARADGVMIDLLSAEDADLNDGDFPPLHIAADGHDPGLIEHLLRSGAEVAASLDWAARSPLETALDTEAPLHCLRLLAAQYPFDADDLNDPDRPLVQAIKTGRSDPLALYLAHGADPGPWHSDRTCAWTLALRHEPEDPLYRLLHLLATVHAERWCSGDDDLSKASSAFHRIVRSDAEPASMASEGIYPAVISGLRTLLADRPPGDDWRSPSQLALYGATLHAVDELSARFTPQFGPRRTDSPDTLAPDQRWLRRTDQLLALQPAWLRSAASQLQQFNINQLKQALTLSFFQRMTDSCPGSIPLAAHIRQQLSLTSGLPAPVTRLLAQAWQDAARHARDWGGDRLDLVQAERFLLPHLATLVARRAELAMTQLADKSTVTWMGHLQLAAMADLAVQGFASHPLDWLMQLEQRHNLRAADEKAVATALIVELGLPPATSDKLAHAWADVILQLATGVRGSSPNTWWREAAQAMSPSIASALVTDEQLELPRVVRDFAEAWCVRQTGPLPGRVSVPVLAVVPALAPAPAPAPAPTATGTEPGMTALLPSSSPSPVQVPASLPLPSPVFNLTSPDGAAEQSPTIATQDPPPRPPVDRKRAGEPEPEARKKPRHQ